MKNFAIILICLSILISGDERQSSAPRPPEGPVEIVVPAEPSGGWDLTAQAIQSVLKQNK